MAREVIKFFGEKHPLSNFYLAPFRLGDIIYPTVEHFYQSKKSGEFYEQLEIIMADTPKEAKHMGRNIEVLKHNWDKKKVSYMIKGVAAKFMQNEGLKKYLLNTGDAYLVEDSKYDDFWGRGPTWGGKNMTGKILMKVRERICNADKESSA